ncbi:hypothetical protein [Actinoplanes sp. NPDC049316]|uniref:ALF repeat-containing protein n=1 Tax=Actinoplanes sp. NPDC049316 TaxID=3154727 RepID=UPI003413B06F
MRIRIGRLGQGTARAAVAASLLGGLVAIAQPPAPAAANPAIVRTLAALVADADWNDDDYEWYRQTVVDIAAYDTEPEVRAAAGAALDAGTRSAVKAFVDAGWAKARTLAGQRKSKARKQVQDWAKSGGPKVKEGAQRALADGDYAIGEFVAYGHELAEQLDHPVADTPAEQDRIRGRVEQMVSFGGPTVIAEGMAALGTGDPALIADFYRTGYATANRADFDTRESIRVAVEARNTALDELAAQAQTAAVAARARADILAANIEAMKLLDDTLVAMQLGVKASRRADQILEEDKPARKNGQRGRTADLQGLLAEATTQAQRAAAAVQQADSTTAAAQTAAAKLIKTGDAHGVDWAKVTIASGVAIQAAAASAETSQHAAEATLADSRALDADANAELHAKNADKWLAAARKQADAAKRLADVAKAQQKIAEDAAARAKKQREVAEEAAQRAATHAARARSARLDAQAASRNAVDRSNAAVGAHGDALKARDKETAAITRVQNTGRELDAATNRCISTEADLNNALATLQKARDEATAAGKDADAATADLAEAARRARNAYDAAQAWAARARAAAATARAEAQRASAAANQAQRAAIKADQDAVTARRASDKAVTAVRGAVNAAQTAKLDAQRTQNEASAAVQESTQAVFQAQIADQAAGAAAASAEVSIDRADVAEYMAAQFAGVNADARKILQVAADAVTISDERMTAAQKRADEAAVAADAAAKAADRAVGDVKPAFDAAAQAVKSANEAAVAAVKAHAAAVDATNQAGGANRAAVRATQSERSAWSDASLAGSAAQTATNAATIAGKAASDSERLYQWAKKQTAQIHTFADALNDQLTKINDEKAKQEAIAQKKKEFEEDFKKGLLTYVRCEKGFDLEACKKVYDFLAAKGKQALDAGWKFLVESANCMRGDEEACAAAEHDSDAVGNWVVQVGAGLWEGAKGLVAGLKMLGDCASWVVVGTDGDYFTENCGKTVEAFKKLPGMLKDHPFELIHLSEWQDNPGKAMGLTLFDVGTFFIPDVGPVAGMVSKLVGGLERLVGSTMAKLAEGVGTISRLSARLGDAAGGIAKLTNITVKIEGGAAKIVDGVAIVDGVVLKLEGSGLKLSGAAENFTNGLIRIEGGAVKVDGKVAKLENATVKVEKRTGPEACAVRALKVRALAVGVPCLGDQPDGSWVGEEFDQPLELAKPYNEAANRALTLARQNEQALSTTMKDLIDGLPGASRQGWKFRLKSPDSLKRKLVGELVDNPDALPDELVGTIQDNIRYTAAFEGKDYIKGVEKAVAQMKDKGFQLEKFKNYWARADKDYQGINSTWLDPKSGQYFELQFHTPESFWLNKAEHPLYEITRTPGMAESEIQFWKDISRDMWGTVEEPAGAAKLQF